MGDSSERVILHSAPQIERRKHSLTEGKLVATKAEVVVHEEPSLMKTPFMEKACTSKVLRESESLSISGPVHAQESVVETSKLQSSHIQPLFHVTPQSSVEVTETPALISGHPKEKSLSRVTEGKPVAVKTEYQVQQEPMEFVTSKTLTTANIETVLVTRGAAQVAQVESIEQPLVSLAPTLEKPHVTMKPQHELAVAEMSIVEPVTQTHPPISVQLQESTVSRQVIAPQVEQIQPWESVGELAPFKADSKQILPVVHTTPLSQAQVSQVTSVLVAPAAETAKVTLIQGKAIAQTTHVASIELPAEITPVKVELAKITQIRRVSHPFEVESEPFVLEQAKELSPLPIDSTSTETILITRQAAQAVQFETLEQASLLEGPRVQAALGTKTHITPLIAPSAGEVITLESVSETTAPVIEKAKQSTVVRPLEASSSQGCYGRTFPYCRSSFGLCQTEYSSKD